MALTSKPDGPRSPIRQPPLRHAGQGLDEELQRIASDEEGLLIGISTCMLVMAGAEWGRWYFQYYPHPAAFSFAAVLVICWCAWRMVRLQRTIRRVQLGRDGERVVGQHLDELRADGCVILHDIPADGFNLDHVVIAPSGVYLVETKAVMKPSAQSKIAYDGQHLEMPGWRGGDDYLHQAISEASWLEKLLQSMTTKSYAVRPVVVFPGWFVTMSPAAANGPVWALNPEALLTYIRKPKPLLSSEQMAEIAHHLRQHVRNQQRNDT